MKIENVCDVTIADYRRDLHEAFVKDDQETKA
jgi:hypothetical protein